MRKQTDSKLAVAMGLMLIGSTSFSTQIVYGLQNASQFKSNSSGDFFIQLGSFKTKANAAQLKSSLQRKTNYPLILKEKKGFYVVLLGPVYSAAKLRLTAQTFNKSSEKVKVAGKNDNYKTNKKLPIPSSRRNTVALERSKKIDFSINTNTRNFASADKITLPNEIHSVDVNNSVSYSGQANYESGRAPKWIASRDDKIDKKHVLPPVNATNSPEFEQIQALYKAGNYQEAINRAKQYLITYPNDLAMHYLLAQSYNQQRKYPLAREQIIFILHQNPSQIRERLDLIRIDSAMGNYSEAIIIANDGLKLFPDNAQLLEAKRGVIMAMAPHNTNTATNNKTPQKLQKTANNLPEYMRLKNLYAQGKKAEALSQAQAYIKVHPDDGDVRLVLVNMYLKDKNYQAAREQLIYALNQTPTYTEARILLINIDLILQDFAQARTLADEGLTLIPGDPDLLQAKKNIANVEKSKKSGNSLKPQISKSASDTNVAKNVGAFESINQKGSVLQSDAFENVRVPGTSQAEKTDTSEKTVVQSDAFQNVRVPGVSNAEKMDTSEKIEEPKLTEYSKASDKSATTNSSETADKSEATDKQESIYGSKSKNTQEQKSGEEEYLRLKRIYNEGKHRQAIYEGEKYLLQNPQDGDVQLVLAQFYLNEKKYSAAKEKLKLALKTTPTYLEVRLLLINTDITTKDYRHAMMITEQGLGLSPNNDELLNAKKQIIAAQTPESSPTAKASYKNPKPAGAEEYKILEKMFKTGKGQQAVNRALNYLRQNPNDGDVRLVLGQYYFKQKQYDLAHQQLLLALNKTPKYTDVRIELVNVDIAANRIGEAKRLLAEGRRLEPDNLELYSLEGSIAFEQARFPRAADVARSVLARDPKNESAILLKENLDSITPRYMVGRNSLGINQQTFYASDQHQVWDYTTLYYGRDTDYGIIYGKVNYNSRFMRGASQAELDAWPVLNKYVYFNINAGYANEPVLFPRVMAGGEAYVTIPKFAEVSLGGKYHKITNTKAYSYYTGSITKEFGNNLITFRPYFYQSTPGSRSILYTGIYRYFFKGDRDHYINFNVLAGRSPDLFDLSNANFITTSLKGGGIDYVFPLFNHSLVIDIGAAYTEQKYPANSLTRRLPGATISIEKRFD